VGSKSKVPCGTDQWQTIKPVDDLSVAVRHLETEKVIKESSKIRNKSGPNISVVGCRHITNMVSASVRYHGYLEKKILRISPKK
jgi:hypothetical protein